MESNKQQLINLFENWAHEKALTIKPLPKSGSYREYFRITGDTKSALAVYNADQKENVAFIEFTKHFYQTGLNVPKIYAEQLDQHLYLIEDLGDETLFAHLKANRKGDEFPEELISTYKKVLEELVKIQVEAGKDINYGVCYPRDKFDKQSIMWDLNYFKYYFLKLAKIPFDEQELENDYHTFADYLLETDCNHFLYRDFQSRNIMLKDGEPYFIDYQGGRKGALQYDLASLLFDAKANIPNTVRAILVEHYMHTLNKYKTIDQKEFTQYFYGYVLVRIMQAMGAYGFRGFYEKKALFLQSIPYALSNLKHILKTCSLPIDTPALFDALNRVIESPELQKFGQLKEQEGLTIHINSFSYKKKGIPLDETENGGGYVFDCRSVHNPGRYEEYKTLTGTDQPVIDFFNRESDIHDFLEHVYSSVDFTVERYLKRNFSNLMVNFGCTGGQHRSVFGAEQLAKHLQEKYDVNVVVRHREQE